MVQTWRQNWAEVYPEKLVQKLVFSWKYCPDFFRLIKLGGMGRENKLSRKFDDVKASEMLAFTYS